VRSIFIIILFGGRSLAIKNVFADENSIREEGEGIVGDGKIDLIHNKCGSSSLPFWDTNFCKHTWRF
jgi:hypothetical protein